MAILLSHYLASSPDDAAARLVTLTHPCGYARGWPAPRNATFLHAIPRLRPFILQEMINQGIVQ